MEYYECHITMEGDPRVIEPLVTELKWKFSAIDGDPILGDGVKCYATRHYHVDELYGNVVHFLISTSEKLKEKGVKVVRRKVEMVVFDDHSVRVR